MSFISVIAFKYHYFINPAASMCEQGEPGIEPLPLGFIDDF